MQMIKDVMSWWVPFNENIMQLNWLNDYLCDEFNISGHCKIILKGLYVWDN